MWTVVKTRKNDKRVQISLLSYVIFNSRRNQYYSTLRGRYAVREKNNVRQKYTFTCINNIRAYTRGKNKRNSILNLRFVRTCPFTLVRVVDLKKKSIPTIGRTDFNPWVGARRDLIGSSVPLSIFRPVSYCRVTHNS